MTKLGSRVPCWVQDEWKNKKVSDLLEKNGGWKEECIKDIFIPMEAEEILSIPRGNNRANDEII